MSARLIRPLARFASLNGLQLSATTRLNLTAHNANVVNRFLHLQRPARSQTSGTAQQSVTTKSEGVKEVYHPTELDKTVLVKAKIYQTVHDVPDSISPQQMRRARDYMRIRINMWMVVATIVIGIGMIFWGRSLRDRGESIEKWEVQKMDALRSEGIQKKALEAAASDGFQKYTDKK